MTTFIALLVLFFTFHPTMRAQCRGGGDTCNPVQLPPCCEKCVNEQTLYLAVCSANQTFYADVVVCTQYGVPPNPIWNPCDTVGCARAVDSITWVKSFCVDQDLKNLGEAALLSAIVRATNLCCTGSNFLGATIPNCDANTTCITSTKAFCHILAMPRCMTKNYVTGCYDKCSECKDFCMIERRYCNQGELQCCRRAFATCLYNEHPEKQCPVECNKEFECDKTYFNGNLPCCPSGGGNEDEKRTPSTRHADWPFAFALFCFGKYHAGPRAECPISVPLVESAQSV
jgi:hypothetical protein